MGIQRPERVQEALRQEISIILQRGLKDPRIGFITITRVELTRDLRYAKIYFSTLGDEKKRRLALKGLKSAKGYIKGMLAEKIKLRYMPELDFRVDNSVEYASTISSILDRLKKEKNNEGSASGDTKV